MTSRPTRDVALLIAVTAITRYAFRSHCLYDIDSINFALALRRFDPSVHQPHPPGYFLYVYLGRLANLIFHDDNAALVAISILFSCASVAMIFVLADHWFGGNSALFSGLIFVFSPLAWFHGTVALTYVVEAFFSALAAFLCWRIYSGRAWYVLPTAFVIGMAAGFRPSSLVMLGPLLLFSLRKTSRKQLALGICILTLTLIAWFIPMIQISGSAAYISSLLSLWLTVPSRGMVFNSTAFNALARATVIIGIYFLCFGVAAALPLLGFNGHSNIDRRKIRFTLVWIVPGLLFFTFVYLRFVNSGYLLVLVPAACVWMGNWASNWYANARLHKTLKIVAIGGCAAANTMLFISAPVYCSYGEVQRFQRELQRIIAVLPEIASPRDTMIVGFDSHFLGYRHAGYYLPEYQTVEFPAVQLRSGTRVFAMHHRDTRLESRFEDDSIRNFIIFPLPSGNSEYSDYMSKVRKRFPDGDLRLITREGHEFAIGPVADLRFIFSLPTAQTGALVNGR